MLTDFIKTSFIFLGCIYLCLKKNTKNSLTITQKFLLSLILSSISSFISLIFPNATYIVPMGLLWVLIAYLTSQPQIAFITTVIGFTISYSTFVLCCLISTIVASPFYTNYSSFPYILFTFLSGLLQTLLIFTFCKYKRFKKGLPLIYNKDTLNFTFFICLLITTLIIPMPSGINRIIKLVILTFFICILVILIHWWQAQITKSYRQALVQRELESLRTELQEKDRLLAEISAKNEELGRLIHKDNKRIPAMEHAVSEFLVMDFDDKETAIERANTLLLEIKELAQDRDNTITEIYASKFKHHNTGISSLDTMLNYMEKRARNEHIKLSVNIALDLNRFVPDMITAQDLTHVLSDLLENAIIAAKQNASPVIQLQFYQARKDFVIEIADNGNPFEANILVNYGLKQITTHADTGGSGIGLMDIWKIKEKYGASLHITEYESNAPYTKKIALIFNKKNRYTISTERKEALLSILRRSDLQIF